MLHEGNTPSKSALVVDDNHINRTVANIFLKSMGFEVHEASCGSEALEFLSNNHTDVVLLDICMPGEDGSDICKRIRSIRNAADFIIAYTSFSSDDFCSSNFDSVLQKPVDFKKISNALICAGAIGPAPDS